jgi:casein kinase I family protein HRR25
MATGTLPWMNLQIESKDLKYAKIHQLKKHIKTEVLCAKLPKVPLSPLS